MEAWAGIEPAYADLQSAASPLCHQAALRQERRVLYAGPLWRVNCAVWRWKTVIAGLVAGPLTLSAANAYNRRTFGVSE